MALRWLFSPLFFLQSASFSQSQALSHQQSSCSMDTRKRLCWQAASSGCSVRLERCLCALPYLSLLLSHWLYAQDGIIGPGSTIPNDLISTNLWDLTTWTLALFTPPIQKTTIPVPLLAQAYHRYIEKWQ